MAEAIDGVDQRLPEIFQILIEKALAGDKECAIYLVDRVLGRPRLSIEANTKIEVELDPSRLLQALREREAMEAEYLLCPESSNTQLAAIDSSGTADKSDEKWDAAGRGLSRTYEAEAKS
jgi:hypothetical protein